MYQKWLSHAAGLSKDMDVLSDVGFYSLRLSQFHVS